MLSTNTTKNCLSFALNKNSDYKALNPDHLLEIHLKGLLNLIILINQNKELKADGFKFLNDLHAFYPINFSENQKSSSGSPLELYEPRITFSQHLIESLLSIIDLESDLSVSFKRLGKRFNRTSLFGY